MYEDLRGIAIRQNPRKARNRQNLLLKIKKESDVELKNNWCWC